MILVVVCILMSTITRPLFTPSSSIFLEQFIYKSRDYSMYTKLGRYSDPHCAGQFWFQAKILFTGDDLNYSKILTLPFQIFLRTTTTTTTTTQVRVTLKKVPGSNLIGPCKNKNQNQKNLKQKMKRNLGLRPFYIDHFFSRAVARYKVPVLQQLQ